MVHTHSKWQSHVSNLDAKTMSNSMWLSLYRWLSWNLRRAVEGLNDVGSVPGAQWSSWNVGGFFLFFFFSIFHSFLLVSFSWEAECSCPSRCGQWDGEEGTAVIYQIPSQGPGKVHLPHQGLPHLSPYQSPSLSLRESLLMGWSTRGHSPWALSRRCGDGHWPFLLFVPLTAPADVLHQQTPPIETSKGAGELEVGWKGAAAALSMSGGYVSCALTSSML